MSADPAARAEELREEILRHDRLYYVEGAPAVSDAEYDALFQELVALEREHPDLVVPSSPTQRVGAPLPDGAGFPRVRHAVPMLSIESLYAEEDVREFDAKVRRYLGLDADEALAWRVEPKFDGVSASLLYEGGELARCVTRGDGVVGEDVTGNLRTIRNLPLALDPSRRQPPELLEVRGEVLIGRASFEALNERRIEAGLQPFANARNAAAGAIRRIDPSEVRRYPLEFHAYAIARVEGAGPFATSGEAARALAEWGFSDTGFGRVVEGVEGCLAYHAEIEEGREQLPFEVDGIVAKLDRIDLRERLGSTARATKWQYAHKFAAIEGTTPLRAIEVQVGVNGRLTPRAHVAPVEVGGVTIRHATLHNEAYVESLDVRIGDRVFVKRAGDVIPQITGVAERGPRKKPDDWDTGTPPSILDASGKPREGVTSRWRARFAMPDTCPVCGADVVREGKYVRCPNVYDCPPQVVGRTIHLAGRGGFEVDSIGEKMIVQLFEEGLLENAGDLFHLDRIEGARERLVALDRWGEKTVENLFRELEERRDVPLERFLAALSIPEVGGATARLLARRFTLDELRGREGEPISEEELVDVDGIGPEVAARIRTWFAEPRNLALVDRLLEGGVRPRAPEDEPSGGPFDGRSVVFTGSLESMTRAEAKKQVERRGGRVVSSVSARTDFLVVGGKPGSKADKAAELGVEVLVEEDFLARLQSH